MRYRIKVVRAQVAERTVTAKDEEAAIAKVMAEVHERYGLFGLWHTTAVEIDSIEAAPTVTQQLTTPKDGAPMLLSVADAAKQLGVSRATFYRLVNTGELESVKLGNRRLISTDAMRRFIETNEQAGRQRP